MRERLKIFKCSPRIASPAITASLFIFSMIFNPARGRAEFELPCRPPYAPARDIIPGFPKQHLDETWVLDQVPTNWRVVSLDGEWKCRFISSQDFVDYFDDTALAPKGEEAGWTSPEASLKDWKTCMVPWSFAAESFPGGGKDGGAMWYARDFETPVFNPKEERVAIRFHGVGFRADIWVNGQAVGKHLGQYTAFDCDVTQWLKPTGMNRLVVRAIDTRYEMQWRNRNYSGLAAPVQLQVKPLLEAARLRLAPRVAQAKLDFDFEPVGPGAAGKGRLSVTVAEFRSGKTAYAAALQGTLENGTRFTGSIPMPNPHCWHPDDPFLYVLTLKWNGVEIARQRFGFREITIDRSGDQQRLLLNGKRIYLRMFEFNDSPLYQRIPGKKTSAVNERGRLREMIMAMKYANLNAFRPHSGEPLLDETFYNLCDELGVFVYLDMPCMRILSPSAAGSNAERGESHYRSLEKQLSLYPDLLGEFHNHPSLCMVSFGNELYSFALPHGMQYADVIAKYTELHKQTDLQQRPTTGSAGGMVLNEKTVLDVVDTHHYLGVYYGCSSKVNDYIKGEIDDIRKMYGQPLPHITSETGDVMDLRLHAVNFKNWRPQVESPDFDREAFLSRLQKNDPETGWVRMAHNAGGVRCYLSNIPEFRKRKGLRLVKRYIEMFRWNRQLMDGVSFNTDASSIASFIKTNQNGPTGNDFEPWPDTPLGELVLTDPIYDFRDSNQPLVALARLETERPLGGATLAGETMLINDTLRDVQCQFTMQLRGPDGRMALIQAPLAVSLKAGEDFRRKFEMSLPESLATGWYKLELYLHMDKKMLSGNGYDLYLLGAADRARQFPADKRVALYDSADDAVTTAMLETLKIPFTAVTDSSKLSSFDVLIIGRNSMDLDLQSMGDGIRTWLQNGGRLLCFEQGKPGDLPWQPGTRIEKRSDGSFIEMLRPQHPVFRGFDTDMVFDRGGGPVFFSNISLNKGLLTLVAADNTAEYLDSTQAMGSAVSDLRVGKGECLVSMVRTDLFGKESAITRFVENCLVYILGNEISPLAVEVPSTASRKLVTLRGEPDFVDISAAANRGLANDANGKGGWTDYGNDDMSSLPTGQTSLDGYVPFLVLDGAKNDGRACIVLKGPTREQFPEKSPEIKVNRPFASLYFLYTAMYVKAKKGEAAPLARFVVHYEDGTEAVFEARNGIEIADWCPPRDDLKEAQAVYRRNERALYSTEWKNPHPRKNIAWLRMESTGNAIPILVAVTGVKPGNDITE